MAGMDIAPIVRTQDFSILKQNEDSKSMIDQSHIGHVIEKKEMNNAQQVVNAEHSEFYNKKQDAREKGANEYHGDGGQQRRKPPQDKVVVKKPNTGFDFRI